MTRPSPFALLGLSLPSLCLGLFVCLWPAGPGKAQAQTQTQRPQPTQPLDTQEYAAAIKTGVDEFQRGNYPEARVAFEKAHAISPNARTLRGIGMAAFEARDYVEAILFLRQALDNQVRALSGTMRSDTESTYGQALDYVWRGTLRLSPATAAVSVDGHEPQFSGPEPLLLLNPGTHELVVHADGYESKTLRVRAKAGRTGVIELDLVPLSKPRQEPLLTRQPGAAKAERFPYLYVLAGAGGSLLLGAAITGVISQNAKGDLEDSCATGTCDEDTRSRGKTFQTATNVLLGLGSAALIGGVVWYFVERAGQDATPPAASAALRNTQLMCVPGECLATVALRF